MEMPSSDRLRPPRTGLLSQRTRQQWKRYLMAYLFLLPALVLYVTFVLRPTIEVFVLSLYKWNGISPTREWQGLANFERLIADSIFWQAFRNNLVWLVVILIFNVLIGLVAAALLSMDIKGRVVFRLAYFLPVVQASIVTAMIWRWIYNPDGLLNSSLQAVGLGSLARGWLGDFTWALPALAVAAGWASFGMSVVLLLAGMQGIDQSLYDAARVDGANYTQTFRYITIPGLRNVITIVILLAMIGAFQAFDIIWATTQGGPVRATEMLATYMFKKGIMENEYGYGSAVAVVLATIILAFAIINITLRERGDE
jgi:raffinose/stachyose/melibiose transport system permease protein